MNIETYIREFKEVLDGFISGYLADLARRRAESAGRGVADLYAVFKEAGRGGKCIRGALVKLGHEIASGRPADGRILPAAAAFEIFQTGILSHDDIIDKSPLRRGKDSIWQASARTMDGDLHYGMSQAICLGDVGLVLANRLVAESAFDAERKIEALSVFHAAQLNTMDGEMLDVLLSRVKDYDDENGILKIASLKTAWYTIAGPMQLGAVLAGGPPDLLRCMEDFGLSLGVAFQLKDDILGIRAAEKEIGKSNTSDIAEGKVTLLIRHALKNASADDRRRLREIYGHPSVSEADRETVQEIFSSTGAFDAAARRAERCLCEAKRLIPGMARSAEHAALLTQLSDMMFLRKA
ncbi:MAG: polyprenyl synthetase family protein [Synergistaceae bacterium]|jgi:geranylgeranyl pyrophosphate synthase|nr:polyprenyl synthetase family protein [Synergistaceae bacterium]